MLSLHTLGHPRPQVQLWGLLSGQDGTQQTQITEFTLLEPWGQV